MAYTTHANNDVGLRNRWVGTVLHGALNLFLPSILMLLTIMMLHYWIYTDSESVSLEESQSLAVDLSKRNVANNLHYLMDEVRFLAGHIRQRVSERVAGAGQEEITRFLINFNQHKQWYDQIRVLDVNGREVVRINNGNLGPVAVPAGQLQDKSKRYYFKEMQTLSGEQIYLSPLDLNVESNRVERPLKPTIRVGITLYGDGGQVVGYLLANYRGNELISTFQQVSAHISERMMLLNGEGFWLVGADDEKNWGFMLDHESSFATGHTQAWQVIGSQDAGQFISDQGLYTFDTLYPYVSRTREGSVNSDARKYYWKVVSFAPQSIVNEAPREFLSKMVPAYLITMLILLFSSIAIARMRLNNIAIQSQNDYERSFRQALESIQLASVILDCHGRIIFCNEHFARVLGYQKSILLTMEWVDLLPDSDQRSGEYTRFLRALMDQYLPEHSEQLLVDVEGEKQLFSWTNTFSLTADGKAESLIRIGRNITEQRRIETELEKLSMAVEQSPNVVMITDTNGNIEYVNPRFVEVTGYQYDEVLGRKPNVVSSGETRIDDYKKLWARILSGETWQGVLKNKKKNGEYYWEKTTISPIFDTKKNITHFLSVKEDITEKQNLKKLINKQEAENLKNRELAAVGTMASMVAHDLRNPLSSIKMAMQILMREHSATRDAESLQQELELIGISQEQIRYMEGILTDLMDYSGSAKISPQWLQVDKVLELTANSLQKKIYANSIELVMNVQNGLPTIYADPIKLRQVFSNLMMNAIQALSGQQDARLEVSATLLIIDGIPKVQVEIEDNGVGIDPCVMNNVFEPFYTNKEKGTGLGLAIAKQLIEKHQGDIRLEHNDKGGVVAKVILPVALEDISVPYDTALQG